MNKINYPQLYSKFIENLPEKTKEIFNRRFGIPRPKGRDGGPKGLAIKNKERETLESIGQSFNITRERVRQIEERGLAFVKEKNQPVLDKIYKEFLDYFKKQGGFKKEDRALEDLGGKTSKGYVYFLLTLGEPFQRICGKRDYYSFWATIINPQKQVKKNLDFLVKEFKKIGKPLLKKDFFSQFVSRADLSSETLLSLFEVSKRIRENQEGEVGLIDWPEINPRGVKDKAFLLFQKTKQPLHFAKVAELINGYPQTVHNELIKDPRFVLVGRGTYALSEWGFIPGTVKDIILKILKENKTPLERSEIVEKVLAQRFVEKNTILMNLNDKKYFIKDAQGKYTLSPLVKGEGYILRKTQLA